MHLKATMTQKAASRFDISFEDVLIPVPRWKSVKMSRLIIKPQQVMLPSILWAGLAGLHDVIHVANSTLATVSFEHGVRTKHSTSK